MKKLEPQDQQSYSAPLKFDPELATHCDQSEGGKRHQFWNLWK